MIPHIPGWLVTGGCPYPGGYAPPWYPGCVGGYPGCIGGYPGCGWYP